MVDKYTTVYFNAGMAELVDAHDSKSCVVIHESSILSPGTNNKFPRGEFFCAGRENRKTEADEPSRGREIFQQKNTRDRFTIKLKVPGYVVADSLSNILLGMGLKLKMC